MNKVSNQSLVTAGLSALLATGRQADKIQTGSRAMIYQLENGETVRVRTCNDHILVVLADSAAEGASLNIEGTDHLLIVMPEEPRSEGPVIAYFIPTDVAVAAVHKSHADWLKSNPSTKGNNRTWNIWFDDESTPCGGFASKWKQHRLPTATSTAPIRLASLATGAEREGSLGTVIAEAKRAIAQAAGVSIDAVKISVVLD